MCSQRPISSSFLLLLRPFFVCQIFYVFDYPGQVNTAIALMKSEMFNKYVLCIKLRFIFSLSSSSISSV